MARLVWRQKAIEDLNNIWNYTFDHWSERKADTYYAEIQKACIHIAHNPEVGKRFFEVVKGVLGLKSGRHIIFYRQKNSQEVEILRVLHERMDLSRQIKT